MSISDGKLEVEARQAREAREGGKEAIRQSEQRFTTLFQTSPFAMALSRPPDYRIAEVNDAFLRLFGFTRGEVIGKTEAELGIVHDPLAREQIARLMRARDRVEDYEYAAHTKGGALIHLSLNVNAVALNGERHILTTIEDVTGRKRAEEALRESQARQTFLLNLNDALRPLNDAVEVQAVAARVLGEHLGVSRAFYVEVETQEDGEYFRVRRDYCAPGVPSAAGRFRADDFGATLFGELRAGRTLPVASVETEPRLADQERAGYLALGIGAYVGAPLIKGGRLVAVLGVHQIVPRTWVQAEIALIEETAERTWAEMERARAEAALAASEEKYRHVFNSIDEGFCVVEMILDPGDNPVDYLFLEVNPVFERLTGLENAVGKTARQLVPNLEAFWAETYGRVALTGEAVRFENYSAPMNRWFDVHASRAGNDASRLVVIVFTDITERRRREANLAFLAETSADFAPPLGANEIMNRVGDRLARHLGLSRCAFSVVDDEADRITPVYDWRRDADAPSLLGAYQISSLLTEAGRRHYRAGKLSVINDARDNAMLRVPPDVLAANRSVAILDAPHLEDGCWTFLLTAARPEAGEWRDDEIELVRELAARIYIRIERARAEQALRESEARQSTILATMAEGVVTLDLENRFVSVNAAAERILGASREELIGRPASAPPFRRLTLDGAARSDRPSLAEVAAGGRSFHDEYAIERRDRSRVVISRHIAALRDEGGACVGFVATLADITERKRHEAALAFLAEVSADLAGLTTISETMNALGAKIGEYFRLGHCLFFEIDEMEENVTIRYCWNRPDLPEIAGSLRIADFVEPDFAERSRAGKTIVARDLTDETVGNPESFISLGIRSLVAVPLVRDGKWRFTLGAYASEGREWRDDEIELMREITTRIWARLERDRAEAALRESEAQFRTLGENMPDPLWLSDAAGRPIYQNLAWQQFTGVTAAQLAASGWRPLSHPDDLPMLERVWREANERGEAFQVEARMQRHDGAYRWCINRTAPLKDAAGRVVRWIGTTTDIHDRKQAAEAIQALNATLEQRVAERTEALLESQEHLRQLSLRADRTLEGERARIAREVHDELGGSLTGLKYTLFQVRSGRQADAGLMDVVQDMAGQIDGLVNTVRRIASDLRPPLLDDLGLTAALAWQAEEFEKRTDITCELDLPRREPNLNQAQQTAIFRAFQESLTNVARHANATRVVAAVTREGREFVLRITDDGVGIRPEALQGVKSLGLAGMRERIREVSGDVEVTGGPGRGTTVTIHVPVLAADD